MKKLIAMMCLLPLPCLSQAITGIVANPKTANIGEEVTFTVNLAVPPDTEPRCGLSVIFGDGSSTDSPIRERNEVPFVISHKYSTPGTYGIRVEGKFLPRFPFKTVLACDGSSNVALNVVDRAAQEAEERAAKEAERATKELKERAANAERVAKEAEERAKEAERVAKEAKEQLINRREQPAKKPPEQLTKKPPEQPAKRPGKDQDPFGVFK